MDAANKEHRKRKLRQYYAMNRYGRFYRLGLEQTVSTWFSSDRAKIWAELYEGEEIG